MTIQEIETVLDELSSRHAPLSKDLLVTLLTASNWEEKNIKEAVAIFTSQPKRLEGVRDAHTSKEEVSKEEAPLPLSKNEEQEEIVFYHPDGSEEKKLEPLPEASPVVREAQEVASSFDVATYALTDDQQKITKNTSSVEGGSEKEKKEDQSIQEQEIKNQEQKEVINSTSSQLGQKSVEVQSLVVPKEDKKPTKQEVGIPDTLPLLPFESSEHVWDFSKYKKVFHGNEEKKPSAQESFVAEVSKDAIFHEVAEVEVVEGGHQVIEEEDIVAEKTPMNKGDESLVFLAVLMLLAIMLILGYMYSNGRL